MEKLKYVIDDDKIVELLGIENFTNKESAILELLKNAYDAQAENVDIQFKEDSIIIIDDGIGMSRDTIYDYWMHVGKSDKVYSLVDDSCSEKRILSGSKVIGRFALARLGKKVVIRSIKEGEVPVRWSTDWHDSILHDSVDDMTLFSGTRIEIYGLRDRWTEKSVKNLIDYLSVTFNDNRMNINIQPNYGKKVSYVFKNPVLGENFTTKISLCYRASDMKLYCEIENDEFLDRAKQYCSNYNLAYFSKELFMPVELLGNKDLDYSDNELESMLKNLGDFSASLYFSTKSSTKNDCEQFCYKHSNLENRYDKGIVLYRNAFSISSFEGQKDWLGINQRARKSPAAATHPTGSWRVRSNQISGTVNIDRQENKYLKDLSNRQGVEENEYFKLFVQIIILGIATFERYRQSIIRLIDKKNLNVPTTVAPIMDKLISGQIIDGISSSTKETKALVDEIKAFQKEIKDIRKGRVLSEQSYKYDVRILNVLATIGLKASSIAHEFNNDRNNINVNCQYIKEALQKYGFWDELCSKEYTKYSYKNVPLLLDRNESINKKITTFMDTMLESIEKKRFSAKKISVNEIMMNIKSYWERDYASINIDLYVDESINIKSSEDIFTVIFDNLILNSWQQNKHLNQIKIKISISVTNGHLQIIYEDFGVGLSPKYINDPMRILDVHESSREDGHGLGMWIVNNTILMTGGEVIEINGTSGFKFLFELGENHNEK